MNHTRKKTINLRCYLGQKIFVIFNALAIIVHILVHQYAWQLYHNKVKIGNEFQDENTKVSIFYNIYIPKESKNGSEASIDQVHSITKEQLRLRNSSISSESTLFYVTNGRNISPLKNCPNCVHLEHNNEGDEVKTLSKLHDFCKHNPSQKVAYIHNKGSFHPSILNDMLRRMLTKAVFSEECLRLTSKNKTFTYNKSQSCRECNICGARFSPLPHFHIPGNMWVANCNYISKLISPTLFKDSMEQLVSKAMQRSKYRGMRNIPSHALIGRLRYSAEHWVASHPENCPCDVYSGDYTWAYEQIPQHDNWTADLAMAPRVKSLKHYANFDSFNKYYKNRRTGKWFTFEGRIFEWKTLYNQIPSNDSWVWSFYKKKYKWFDNNIDKFV
jgi:hypothetical protein